MLGLGGGNKVGYEGLFTLYSLFLKKKRTKKKKSVC